MDRRLTCPYCGDWFEAEEGDKYHAHQTVCRDDKQKNVGSKVIKSETQKELDDFLYSLAEQRYRMFSELYKFNLFAETSEECFKRIVYQSKFEGLTDTIHLLPDELYGKLKSIEQEFFHDAPYVLKK